MTYGFVPTAHLDFAVNSPVTAPAVSTRLKELSLTQQLAILELKHSQYQQKRFADRHCRDLKPLDPGQLVWLDSRNLRTDRPSAKLDHRRLGPFRISKVINPDAYRLTLPPTMKVHNVFHISLLQPVSSNYHVDSVPPPPIVIDESLEYKVEKILDVRVRRNRYEYLVDWKGYGPSERTWEPRCNLDNASELVNDFHRRNPDLPKKASTRSLKGNSVRI